MCTLSESMAILILIPAVSLFIYLFARACVRVYVYVCVYVCVSVCLYACIEGSKEVGVVLSL